MMFNLLFQFRQRILHHLNKISAARGESAEIDDGIALGGIIGYRQHFAVRLKAMGGAFDHLVRRLP